MRRRGAHRSWRELMGAAMNSDGYDPVKPDPSGEFAGEAIAHAIELAGLTPRDIDHVNAHATGTTFGDLAEARAIHRALGDGVPAVYAPKSALGHSLGAAGSGGGHPDGAGPARRDRAAHPQPRGPRPGNRSRRGCRCAAARRTTATPSAIPSRLAGTTSRWSSAPPDAVLRLRQGELTQLLMPRLKKSEHPVR